MKTQENIQKQMVADSMIEYFMGQVFETKKGKLTIKDNIFKTLLFTGNTPYLSQDDKVSILATSLSRTVRNHKAKDTWANISSNANHPEWSHIKRKTYNNAKGIIFEDGLNIFYKTIKGKPVAQAKWSLMTENQLKAMDDELDPKSYLNPIKEADCIKWFKANKEDILKPNQVELFHNLSACDYDDYGWGVEYEKLTGKKARGESKSIKTMSKSILSKWEAVESQRAKDKELVEMLEGFLQMEEADMIQFLKFQFEEETKLADIIGDNLPTESAIEMNRFLQGKGFISRQTLYAVSNIVSNFSEEIYESLNNGEVITVEYTNETQQTKTA